MEPWAWESRAGIQSPLCCVTLGKHLPLSVRLARPALATAAPYDTRSLRNPVLSTAVSPVPDGTQNLLSKYVLRSSRA